MDNLHLVTDYPLAKFPAYAWLGTEKVAMLYPKLFATTYNILFWYVRFGQAFGVLSLAVNRLAVVGYNQVMYEEGRLQYIILWYPSYLPL